MNEKIQQIINLLYELDKDVKKKTTLPKGKIDFSKETFLKLRFKDNKKEYEEYQKLSKFKCKDGEFTKQKNIESESDNINYSVIYRKKEKRYMSYFSFLGKRYYAYSKNKTEAIKKIKLRGKELISKYKDVSKVNENSLNNWFNYWNENMRKPQIKETTYLQTIELYERHVIDKIGKKNIKKITSVELQKFINNLLSKDARRKIHFILKNIFDMLHKMNIISKNIMAVVINPKNIDETIINKQKDNNVITYKQEIKLLERIKNSKSFHAVKFLLYTGLRRGELLGLQWKHIDLLNNILSIEQQFIKETGKITTTKTKAGFRKIPILNEAREVLNTLIKNKTSDNQYIFKDVKRLTNHLVYFSKECGFRITPHILRHTFASRCYFAGLNPKILQTWLGHESIDTTLNTYTHVLDYEEKPIINKLKKYFIDLKLIQN